MKTNVKIRCELNQQNYEQNVNQNLSEKNPKSDGSKLDLIYLLPVCDHSKLGSTKLNPNRPSTSLYSLVSSQLWHYNCFGYYLLMPATELKQGLVREEQLVENVGFSRRYSVFATHQCYFLSLWAWVKSFWTAFTWLHLDSCGRFQVVAKGKLLYCLPFHTVDLHVTDFGAL